MRILAGLLSSGVILGGAAYATYAQVGVATPKIQKQSIRNRSVGHIYYGGGHRYGK